MSTSVLGLFTVQLGSSVPLTSVNWDNGTKFMQVELDLGSGFIDLGTQQLLSVPYALHAGSVHLNVSSTGDTLFVGDGSFVIIPGISEANSFTTGTTLHTCGAPNVHNPDLTYGSMTDQEGNVYKTIVIGTQEWMAENLNTSIYRNGDAIATGLYPDSTLGAWSYYNDDLNYACPFGKLYNWLACIDSRQLCPLGWHLPDFEDWNSMIIFLDNDADVWNSTNDAGSSMKAIGTLSNETGLWESVNLDATNSSGFSALPGGATTLFGSFSLGGAGIWWSASEINNHLAIAFVLWGDNTNVLLGQGTKGNGYSVRCLRD